MGKKDLYISVPSFFRCPISLDVMKSPVSLSTGVTYDRTSIQQWLDSGNNTCPATMQVLDSKVLVPNHTLHRLIQTWSNNNNNNNKQFHSFVPTQLLDLITRVSNPGSPQTRLESFIKILRFASESPENRKILSSNEMFLKYLLDIVVSDGPDLNPDLLETVLKIIHLIVTTIVDDKHKNKKKLLLPKTRILIPNFAKILKTAGSGSRVAVVGILESTAIDPESKKTVFENPDILSHLLDILRHYRSNNNSTELMTVLSCLISLTTVKQNKVKLINSGGVNVITNLISHIDDNHDNYKIIEFLFTLLEMLVGCTEGRAAISDNPNCVPGIVKKLMKVSMAANEHAVALLWSLCYLFRDQKSREIMIKSNGGLTKILLMMQSDCSPAVKRMCCDLLRIFRVNSKSCLSSYDTKTTHIMPC